MATKKTNHILIELCHDHSLLLDTREIFLHGLYTSDDLDTGVDHRMAQNFIKNLRILERSSEPIIIHQYSDGGDWYAGMAIYDAIKNSKNKFIFLCHGIAGSMASIIPQSCLENGYRISMPNCIWLIHDGHINPEGVPKQVYSNIDHYKELDKTMYDIYTEACSHSEYFKDKTLGNIRKFLKAKISAKLDWYFTAREAVDYGFCDAVLGDTGYEDIKTIKEYL